MQRRLQILSKDAWNLIQMVNRTQPAFPEEHLGSSYRATWEESILEFQTRLSVYTCTQLPPQLLLTPSTSPHRLFTHPHILKDEYFNLGEISMDTFAWFNKTKPTHHYANAQWGYQKWMKVTPSFIPPAFLEKPRCPRLWAGGSHWPHFPHSF